MKLSYRLASFVLGGLLCASATVASANIGSDLNWRMVSMTPEQVSLNIGDNVSLSLPTAYKLHQLMISVSARECDAAGEVWVNGDKIGDMYVTRRTQQTFTMEVDEMIANTAQVIARPALGCAGRLVINSANAWVTDRPGYGPQLPSGKPCNTCSHLPFPAHYSTVIGNVSSRGIELVNQLEGYTNYRDYGLYLLPIKKAAVRALSVAEANGDASAKTRPFAVDLLRQLDCAESYLDNMFEIDEAFSLSQQLLQLREYIRDILD